jgi:hypothetical protein
MGFLWAVTGLVEPQTPNAGQPLNEVGFVQMIIWAVLLFGWVKSHARAKQVQAPPGASILAAILPPVGVPYYALRTFGAREGLKLTGWALLALLAFFGVYSLAWELSVRYVA